MTARKEELWLICPDTHAPLHDEAAMNCMYDAIKIARPTGFLHLGDVGEFESVSHWRWKRRKRPPLEYVIADADKEIALVNQFLDEIDASLAGVGCENKVVTLGNHDDWLNQFCTEFPYLPQYRPGKAMRLLERGYWVHASDSPRIPTVGKSKLRAYHGHHVGGQYHARHHALKFGASVVYGHWHDTQMHSVQTLGGHHAAWSLGCLRNMNAPFLGGRPTNWSHAFALVHVLPSGNYDLEVVNIEKGMAYLWGHKLDGNPVKTKRRKT